MNEPRYTLRQTRLGELAYWYVWDNIFNLRATADMSKAEAMQARNRLQSAEYRKVG